MSLKLVTEPIFTVFEEAYGRIWKGAGACPQITHNMFPVMYR